MAWLILGFSLMGLTFGPMGALLPELFPTHVRYAGFAITYNLATAVFGGTAPLANEALIEATGTPLVPAFYMMAACVVGLIAVRTMKETAGASLRGTEIPETKPQDIIRARARA